MMNRKHCNKAHRFACPVIGIAVVLVVLRTCMLFTYSLENFEIGDVTVRENVEYESIVRSVDRTPRWSSDGQTIAVNIYDSIYAVNTDGEDLRRIPKKKSTESKYGEFSPTLLNEGRVAYQLYLEDNVGFFDLIVDDEGNYIESAKLDGTDVKRVAYTGNIASNPVSSPDGSRIAFFTSEHGLTTAKSNGSDIRYSKNLLHGSEATWSGDGQSIALLVYSEAKQTHAVKTVRWDGTDVRTVVKFESKEPVLSSLEWSPDGETMYFMRSDRINPTSFLIRLYSVNSNSSDLRILLDLGERFGASKFAVSPDGRELLFTKPDGVYLINTDGTNLRNITSGYDFTYDTVINRLDLCTITTGRYVSWSPDGSRAAIFYQAKYPIIDGRRLVLFTMARDGSDIRALITSIPDRARRAAATC